MRKTLLFLQKDQGLLMRFIRFAAVGGFTSLLYLIFVIFSVEVFNLSHELSSALSYVVTIPINYIAHRRVTFQSDNKILSELAKYLFLHGCNLLVSVVGMFSATEYFGYPYWVGAFTAAVLVPITSFLIMNFWVFLSRPPKS